MENETNPIQQHALDNLELDGESGFLADLETEDINSEAQSNYKELKERIREIADYDKHLKLTEILPEEGCSLRDKLKVSSKEKINKIIKTLDTLLLKKELKATTFDNMIQQYEADTKKTTGKETELEFIIYSIWNISKTVEVLVSTLRSASSTLKINNDQYSRRMYNRVIKYETDVLCAAQKICEIYEAYLDYIPEKRKLQKMDVGLFKSNWHEVKRTDVDFCITTLRGLSKGVVTELLDKETSNVLAMFDRARHAIVNAGENVALKEKEEIWDNVKIMYLVKQRQRDKQQYDAITNKIKGSYAVDMINQANQLAGSVVKICLATSETAVSIADSAKEISNSLNKMEKLPLALHYDLIAANNELLTKSYVNYKEEMELHFKRLSKNI